MRSTREGWSTLLWAIVLAAVPTVAVAGVANDTCTGAQPVLIGTVTNDTTVGATTDAAPFCGTSNTAPGVWFTVIGNGTTLTASTCELVGSPPGSATYDTKISVYCRDCIVPICVGGNDDVPGCNFRSAVVWCSQNSANYLILVHGFGAATGSFGLGVSSNGTSCPTAVDCLPPPMPPLFRVSDDACPPPGADYEAPTNAQTAFGDDIRARNFDHGGLTNPIDPPPVGESREYTAFGTTVDFEVSIDGGITFMPLSGQGDVRVRITNPVAVESTGVFQTEMLALDISGGSLPPGTMIRESPSLVSPGEHVVLPAGGDFLVGGFFEVWLELSMDGGQTWTPAQTPVHVQMQLEGVPALSGWGLIILALLLFTTGTITSFVRRLP